MLKSLLSSYLNQTSERKFWQLLFYTSIIKLIYLSLPELIPQEAYHWAWGKNLDWSYFDHPPMVAYSITFFTRIFWDSVFWVRVPVWLYGIGDAILVFLISWKFLKNTRTALWTLAAFNVVPIFLIGSIVMTPDVPFIFFWLLTIWAFLVAVEKGAMKFWLLAGASAGLAMMSKYPAVLLFPSAFLFLLLSKRDRHWLIKPHPYLTVLPAIAIFSNVIYWNSRHDWVSFLFQTSRRANEVVSIRWDTLLQHLLQQIGVTNPVIYGIFIFSLVYVARTRMIFTDRRYAALFSFSIVPFAVCIGISLMYFVKMNWAAPAYVTGFMLTSLLFIEKNWIKAPKIGLFVGFAFMLFAYLFPVVPLYPFPGNTWEGWRKLGKEVSTIRENMERPDSTFIFGNRYKISVEMWFYNKGKLRTFAQNTLGLKALQFDYWDSPDSKKGWDAIFAWADIEPFDNVNLLEQHFERIEKQPDIAIQHYGKTFKRFGIYKCYGYRGVIPANE